MPFSALFSSVQSTLLYLLGQWFSFCEENMLEIGEKDFEEYIPVSSRDD